MSNTIKDAKIHRNELISLAPTYEAKDTTEIYKKYIDEILNEKEHQRSKKYKNKNIAISGGYGAGKSSILNTYFKNEETGQMLQDKVLFVSLGSYIENNDNKLDGKEQKAVEVSILQQIIYSVAPEDIPFSRISRIDHDRTKLIVWTVVIALLLIPLITYKLDFYSGDNTCSENILTLVGLGIFFSIWWGLYYILNKYNINVIHLGSSNAKAEANQNELSLLNKYIDELVYFFKTTNKEIIVFEDIDRLEECQKVFTKLKEINSIINTSIKCKTVRFIYCIGEDIFENAEKKTKFFDIIIPIIPYIGTSTSREILAKELNEKQNEDIPNSDLITIGRFISNPRIAFEIINEYKIFKNNMNDNDMKIQLLYLISYKVLFPKEFEYLQRNEGTLAYTLSPEFEKEFLEYLHNQRKAASERELKRLEDKLSLKIKPYVASFISYLVENFDITNSSKAIFMDEKTNKITSLKEISDDYLKIFEIEPYDLVLRVDDENIPEEKIFANESKIDFFKKIENHNIQSNIIEIKQSIENENDSFINLDDYTHEKEEYIKAIEMLPSHLFYPKNMILNQNEKTNNKMITLNRFEEILIERKYINANTKKLIVRKHNEIISKNDDNIITKTTNNTLSYTSEISLEEYLQESQNNTARSSTTGMIETTYKKLTTSISSNGAYYRYKAILMWKNIPKVRSYDSLAIGHYASVTQKGNLYFTQEHCTSTTNCTSSSTFTPQKFSKGASATFKIPTGNIISLKQILYFDVKKNVDATIIRQIACGDYSHATKTISATNSLNLTVNDSGINLNSSISNYYDEISPACATWDGSW